MAQQTIHLGLKIDADASSAKASLNQLHQELNKLQTQNFELGGLDKEFREAATAAKELQTHLLNATNKFGQIDIGKFAQSMKASNTSVKTLATSFLNAGKQGQAAFSGLANQIINAQKPALSFSNILTKMGTTLANNIRWQVSSAAINAFTSSIREAWDYTKEMDKALTNIRVVTGKSREEMDELAQSSNKMAKALKSTTTEMVKGQLIYYQQGDSAALAAEKARITAMAANVSFNSSQEEMADYLTAIWNSYQVGEGELELFVDKLSAVGAATATSMEEIATGMTKVAASANAVGVTYDQLNATIATISSTTRVSAESVGTAMKTIYARMGDLKVGKEDEDGITYGQVSSTMKQMGIDIADANGQLRDMGEVVEEIGGKWKTFSKEEQQALVQAVAGKRQYTNLTALFENWDMYLETLEVSKDAMGTLQEQQDAWADSWEGASNRVRASLESLWQNSLDSDVFIGGANVLAGFLDFLDKAIESAGGLGSVLLAIGGILTNVFNRQITNMFAAGVNNVRIMFGGWEKELQRMRVDLESLPETYPGFSNLSRELQNNVKDFAQLAHVENAYMKNQNKMSTAQKETYNFHKQNVQALQKERHEIEETIAENEEYLRSLEKGKLTGFKAGRAGVDLNRNNLMIDKLGYNDAMKFLNTPMNKVGSLQIDDTKLKEVSATINKMAKNYNIELGLEDDETDVIKIRNAWDELIRKAKEPIPDINFNLLDDIQRSKTAIDAFTNEFKEMSMESTMSVDDVKQKFMTLANSLNMSGAEVDTFFDEFNKDGDMTEMNLGQIVEKLNLFRTIKTDSSHLDLIKSDDPQEAMLIAQAYEQILASGGSILLKNGEINSSLNTMGKTATTTKNTFTGITSSLMSAASAGMSLSTSLTSFTDGDMAGGLMGITSAVMSIAMAFTAVNAAMGWVSVAITLLIAGISIWQKYHKTAKEKIQDLNSEIETLSGEIESLNGELETTRDKIDKLQAKGTLSLVEQDELEKLLQQEASLERQVKLKKELENEANREKTFTWIEDNKGNQKSYTTGWGKVLDGAKLGLNQGMHYTRDASGIAQLTDEELGMMEKSYYASQLQKFIPVEEYEQKNWVEKIFTGAVDTDNIYYSLPTDVELDIGSPNNLEQIKQQVKDMEELGVGYIQDATKVWEKEQNEMVLHNYTELFKGLADEARAQGDLEGYADYVADVINEQIMYNPDLENFSTNFAEALAADPDLLKKNINELPASIQPGIQKFIDLGIITEENWADVINNFNNGILSLNAEDFTKNIDWMLETAEKKIDSLKGAIGDFDPNKGFTNEERNSILEAFPSLTPKELVEYEEQLKSGEMVLDEFYNKLKNKDFDTIKFNLKFETEAEIEEFDWSSIQETYALTDDQLNNIKEQYKSIIAVGSDYGKVMEILNSKTFDHYELTKDGLTFYDEEGKALKTLTGEYEDLAKVFNFLEGKENLLTFSFDGVELIEKVKETGEKIEKEVSSWGNLKGKGLSSNQRESLKNFLPTLTDEELTEYSNQLYKGELVLEDFIQEIQKKKFDSIKYEFGIEVAANWSDTEWEELRTQFGLTETEISQLKMAYRALADKGIAYAEEQADGSIKYFDSMGNEITNVDGIAKGTTAKLIALGNQGIKPLSSYPGLSEEVYNSIISTGTAAGWSSTMINSTLNALSNLSGFNLDLSSSISELGECSVAAQRAVAALLMAQGLEIKVDTKPKEVAIADVHAQSGGWSAGAASLESMGKTTMTVNEVSIKLVKNGTEIASGANMKEVWGNLYGAGYNTIGDVIGTGSTYTGGNQYKNNTRDDEKNGDGINEDGDGSGGGGDDKSAEQKAFEAEKRKYDEALAQAEADLENGLIDEKEYRKRVEVAWANLISAYQALSSEEKEDAEDTMRQESLNIRQVVIDYFDNIYDSWIEAYEYAEHLYGSGSKAAELENKSANALKTLMSTGGSKELYDVYQEWLEASQNESLSQAERDYAKTRATEVWDVITGLEADYTDYDYLDGLLNKEQSILQENENVTYEDWQEHYQKRLDILKKRLEDGKITYQQYRAEALGLINAEYWDSAKGEMLPIFSADEREEKIEELNADDAETAAEYFSNEAEHGRKTGYEAATEIMSIADQTEDADTKYDLTEEGVDLAFEDINERIEEGKGSYSDNLAKLREIIYDDSLTDDQKENAIEQFRDSVNSSFDGFIEEIEDEPWRLQEAWDGTIEEFGNILKEASGYDISTLTRGQYLSLLEADDREIIEAGLKDLFTVQEEQLNSGTISWETFWKNRVEMTNKYSAALTEGEKQMYLNEEKAAESFASNLKSRYDKGELTTEQYVERIKSITGVDDYFKKNEIFAVLNSEIDEFYKRLEDGSITTLSDYMSNVKQELLDAGLWATEWGNEIWNEALAKGTSYTSSKYKAEYDNLMAQQTLADWGMTNDYNLGNAAEYKMPYAQKWYEQEKANLDYYVANWKGTGSILDDEGYQTQIANVQAAKDNLKGLVDEHLQFSFDWIDHEKSMGRLTLAEETAAYQRIRKNLEEQFSELSLIDAEDAINWYKEQSAKLRQAEIDSRKAEADQYADILKERLEDEKAYYENLKSIREKSFDASQTIRESQHELNLELQKSLTMYEYLDEETRKLIFNEEDYVALTKELNSIQIEINDLTSTYESKIASATTEEAELLTAEYEAQVELKLKEFEIAKANLEITKKQMALQNTLNERNTRMFINGQWTWVANQEQVAKAREDLMKAEFDAETATLEYEHEQAMNQLDNAINDIQRDVNKIDKALEDLEKVINGTDGLTVTLEDLDKVVEDTIKYIKNSKNADKVVKIGDGYLTNSEWDAVQKEAKSVSNSKNQINPVTGKPYVTDKLGYAIVNGIRVKLNAEGDIVNRPTISMVGEDGPEAIIPLSPKYRDRGLSLWEEATKALGVAPSFTMPTIRASFPQQKENMNVSQTINVTVQNEDSSNDFYAITNLL